MRCTACAFIDLLHVFTAQWGQFYTHTVTLPGTEIAVTVAADRGLDDACPDSTAPLQDVLGAENEKLGGLPVWAQVRVESERAIVGWRRGDSGPLNSSPVQEAISRTLQ